MPAFSHRLQLCLLGAGAEADQIVDLPYLALRAAPARPVPAPVSSTASQNATALRRAKIGAIMDWGRCPLRHQ